MTPLRRMAHAGSLCLTTAAFATVPWPNELHFVADLAPASLSPPAYLSTANAALPHEDIRVAAAPFFVPGARRPPASAALLISIAGLSDSISDKTRQSASPVESEMSQHDDMPGLKVVEVQKGDTLLDILLGSGVSQSDAAAAIDALTDVFKPKDLKPGQAITLDVNRLPPDSPGDVGVELASLSLQPSLERDVVVKRDDGGSFVASAIQHPLERINALAGGIIDSSLFEAGQDAAVPVDVMAQVVKAFSYDVDFQREVQPGDRFEILYERYEDEKGRLARSGNVLYAALILSGTTKEIYRYEPQDGVADFFNAQGESIRKDLLRTPLDVIRITSSFGMRKDPILGYSKMHRGVDFAASIGTPIFAAGNGVIARIGQVNGYGNYIQIKHNTQYATAYGHMSRFAGGLHAGSKVRQGDVIGYVGMTGRATGPHLHYEVLVNGSQINPMSVKLAGHKLDGKDLRRFEVLKADLKTLRRDLGSPVLVARSQPPH
jgi:murein DD-endopeptidase MepM/ murein hydrolase activator NlpD